EDRAVSVAVADGHRPGPEFRLLAVGRGGPAGVAGHPHRLIWGDGDLAEAGLPAGLLGREAGGEGGGGDEGGEAGGAGGLRGGGGCLGGGRAGRQGRV